MTPELKAYIDAVDALHHALSNALCIVNAERLLNQRNPEKRPLDFEGLGKLYLERSEKLTELTKAVSIAQKALIKSLGGS